MIRKWVFLPTKCLARIALSPFFAICSHGLEHIPLSRGFILLPKHQRWTDIPLLSLAANKSLYYVAKQELFDRIVIRWYLKSLGGIPLDRSRPIRSKDSFRKIQEILREGGGIVVFPEGTYYPEEMGPIRDGMIRFLVRRGDVPFIPTGIRYARGVFRTRVDIVFGEPVWWRNRRSDEDFIEEIRYTLASLSEVPLRRMNRND